jgi:formylglycine-generating enzyme required for sulfatase activity/serine/threonine protein kinase
MNPAVSPLSPGAIAGAFQIESIVGSTWNTNLYLATDLDLGRHVNLVEFAPQDLVQRLADGQLGPAAEANNDAFEAALKRFMLQCRVIGALDHPNLSRVDRMFQANGTAYLSVPVLPGETLDKLLDKGPLPLARVRDLFQALAGALGRAHELGMLHQNLQPGCILLDEAGNPVLGGFDVAAARPDGAEHRFDPDQAAYLAPEQQLADGFPEASADIYGLSATLYQCLTGTPPPTASERAAVIQNGGTDPLRPLPVALRQADAEGLCEAIEHGLELDPDSRPRTVDQWRQPLASLDWRRSVKPKPGKDREDREWLPPMLLGAILAVLVVVALYLVFSEPFERAGNADGESSTSQPAQPPPIPPEETRRWQSALQADTILAYRGFLEDYPESVYVEQAGLQLDILDNKTWDELSAENRREAYVDYLDLFPLGLHQEEAHQRIAEIDQALAQAERERIERERQDNGAWETAARQRTVEAMNQYLEAWPDGMHADEARGIRAALVNAANDFKAFEAAVNLNTPDAIQAYIDAFPQGAHVADALAIMDRIDLRPGKQFRDCPECPVMTVVPGGTFAQGSPEDSELGMNVEKPQRTVTIVDAFAIGVQEVSMAQWDACVVAGGCSQNLPDNDWGRGTRPAIMVSWDDVQEYLAWLSERSGQTYRLPSESEWEYAARAGEQSDWLGGDPAAVCEFGNIAGTETGFSWQHEACADTQPVGTAPAASFRPNAFGLYDMIGNVAEWTADCINLSYLGAPTDGSAWGRGICSSHMTRGGSWVTGTREIRLPARFNLTNGDRNDFTGFRVVRSVEQ